MPDPSTKVNVPSVMALFIPTEFAATEPVPVIDNVSPETILLNEVISELRTLVEAS